MWQAYTQSKVPFFIMKDKDRNRLNVLKEENNCLWNSNSVLRWFYLHRVWEAFAVGSETVERKVSWFNICRNYNKCKKCNRNVFSQCFLHKDRELRRKPRQLWGLEKIFFQVWRQMFLRLWYLPVLHSFWLYHHQLDTANPRNSSLNNQLCHSTIIQLTRPWCSWDMF